VVPSSAGNGDTPDAVAATAEENGDAGPAAAPSDGDEDGSAEVVASSEIATSDEPGNEAPENDQEKAAAAGSDS
jgi:hypothetical protein